MLGRARRLLEQSRSETEALLAIIHSRYLPNKVLAGIRPDDPHEMYQTPLLQDRSMVGGHSTVHLCHKHSCKPPIVDPDALRQELEFHGS